MLKLAAALGRQGVENRNSSRLAAQNVGGLPFRPWEAFENPELERADYTYRAVLRPFASAFAPGLGLMIAGTELKCFLEVTVPSLGEVAHPAPASAPRTGRSGHQSPIPSSAPRPWPSSG